MRFVDGSMLPPSRLLSDGNSNPAYTSYFKQDQLILSWIISFLTESVLAQVLDHESAFAMWNALTSIYASTSQARIQQLELQLRSMKKGSMPMPEFIQKIKMLVNQLAVAGSPLSDQQIIICILTGIGSDYASLAASVTSRLEPMTLDEFTGILISHELLFRPSQAHAPPPVLANSAHLCNKLGHIAANCFHRSNFSAYPAARPPQHQTILPPTSSFSVAYYATDPWILDSGATHHITQDMSNLQISNPYTDGERVQVGNGADIPIQNTGQGYWPRPPSWDT